MTFMKRKETPWRQRSIIIFFHLHPVLGNKKMIRNTNVQYEWTHHRWMVI